MRFMQLIILVNASLLAGCSWPIKPSLENLPSPLVTASCPALAPLGDDSMGALLTKLVEVANQYRECREAALAGQPVPKTDFSLDRMPRR